jgi:hypothetical protein
VTQLAMDQLCLRENSFIYVIKGWGRQVLYYNQFFCQISTTITIIVYLLFAGKFIQAQVRHTNLVLSFHAI